MNNFNSKACEDYFTNQACDIEENRDFEVVIEEGVVLGRDFRIIDSRTRKIGYDLLVCDKFFQYAEEDETLKNIIELLNEFEELTKQRSDYVK